MKRIIQLLLLLLLAINTFAQNILISNLKQHDLWLKIPNPICVMVDNVNYDSVFITTDNGIVKNVPEGFQNYNCNKGAFYIIPEKSGRAIIEIKSVVNADTIKIGHKYFAVKDFAELIGIVGGMKNDTIRNKVLAAQLGIHSELDYSNFPFDLDINFKVIKYSVIIIQNEKCNYYNEFNGRIFSDELKKLFATLKSNDKVLFFGINAVGPDKIERNVRNVELVIK